MLIMEKQKVIFISVILTLAILNIIIFVLDNFYSSQIINPYDFNHTLYYWLFYILIVIIALACGLYSLYRQGKKDLFITNLFYPAIVVFIMFIVLLLMNTYMFRSNVCSGSSECWEGFFELIIFLGSLVYFAVIFLFDGIIWLVQKFRNNR